MISILSIRVIYEQSLKIITFGCSFDTLFSFQCIQSSYILCYHNCIFGGLDKQATTALTDDEESSSKFGALHIM